MAETRGVDALERALTLLDCFDSRTPALPLAELSRRSGLYKSTILRLAVSLERFGYLARKADGRFQLGPAAWRLGAAYRNGFDIGEIIRPELALLAESTCETASFYVREGENRVCLFRCEPVRAIRHSILEGSRLPLASGASGHVLRAFSGDQPSGPLEARVRSQGFAISRGERDPEVAALAVPLLDQAGALRGALALSGLVTRFSDEAVGRWTALLRAAQTRIQP